MPEEPVIIVDDEGTEHEFPPGFDPKRAAEVVRGRTGGFMSGFVDQYKETGSALKELGSAVLDVARPPESLDVLGARVKGFGEGVVGGLKGAWQTIKDPLKAQEMVTGIATGEAEEPTSRRVGRAVASGTMALIPFAPKAARGAARGVRNTVNAARASNTATESAIDAAARLGKQPRPYGPAKPTPEISRVPYNIEKPPARRPPPAAPAPAASMESRLAQEMSELLEQERVRTRPQETSLPHDERRMPEADIPDTEARQAIHEEMGAVEPEPTSIEDILTEDLTPGSEILGPERGDFSPFTPKETAIARQQIAQRLKALPKDQRRQEWLRGRPADLSREPIDLNAPMDRRLTDAGPPEGIAERRSFGPKVDQGARDVERLVIGGEEGLDDLTARINARTDERLGVARGEPELPGDVEPILAQLRSMDEAPTPAPPVSEAEALRRYEGADDAARHLNETIDPEADIPVTPDELRNTGPSRHPLKAEEASLDKSFRRLIDDERGSVTAGGAVEILKLLNSIRIMSYLSGLAVPKSILGNTGAILTAAMEKGSLRPIIEAGKVGTNFRELLEAFRSPEVHNTQGISGLGRFDPFARTIGGFDTMTQKLLQRAGLSEDEARRILLTRENPLGQGRLQEMIGSGVGRAAFPFQRTPFNQFIEGGNSVRDIGKWASGEDIRKNLLTAGVAAGGAYTGSQTKDPRILGLLAALAGPRGLPFLMAAGLGGAGKIAGAGASPIPEYGVPTDLKSWIRMTGIEPAFYRAYLRKQPKARRQSRSGRSRRRED